jgi:oligopeptidase B
VVPLGPDGYGEVAEVGFDEPLFAAGAGGNPEFDQPTVRFGYTSFVTPSTVYDLDVRTGERHLLKRQNVLGGYDPADYDQAREWATAADGTRVPVSLVWRRDAVPAEGPSPVHLYGYGSYEHSIDPGFSVARLSLLDRGVVFAVAHVRGGGELGRSWYEHGKTLTKKNTFTDFVAVADHLIAEGRTTPELMVAEGGSAGGLLMGAVANIAPDRFAGIVAAVPFVDALTSILDPDLPLTVIEWDEWGDPLHDAEVYEYMRGYSPYENVRDDVTYPRILAVTSINDTRVLYVEPAKWVARLREVGAPVLLKTEMSAGHGGVSGRYESWRERAFEIAWILDVLGRA